MEMEIEAIQGEMEIEAAPKPNADVM